MRFHIGSPPRDEDFQPEEEGWSPLREPSPLLLNVLAIPFGGCAAVLLFLGWARQARLDIVAEGSDMGRLVFAALLLVALAAGLTAIIAVHELIHGVAYPHFGLTRNTVIGVWPSRLLFYAGYLKRLRRDRCLIVYLLPFLVLSVLPLIVYRIGAVDAAGVPDADQMWAWLYFLSLLNGLFSGGDLLYVLLILLQVPRRAHVQNHGWGTWWKRPE